MLVPLQLKLHLHQRSISLHPPSTILFCSPSGRCFSNRRLLFPVPILFSSRRPLPVQRTSWDASSLRICLSTYHLCRSTTAKYIESDSKSSASNLKISDCTLLLLPTSIALSLSVRDSLPFNRRCRLHLESQYPDFFDLGSAQLIISSLVQIPHPL